MSIKKSFNGKSIRKPGAYSRSKVDNSAGAPLRATDVIFIAGESSKGAPGSSTGIVTFDTERLDALVEMFGDGPLVDCALAAARPSKQNGIGGASRIKVYKTNASTQASVTLSSMLVFKDKAWGVDGNKISITVANGTNTTLQKKVTISKLNGVDEVMDENPGTAVMSIQYTGNGGAAGLVIAGASKAAKTLAVTLSGAASTDGSVSIAAITLANYTFKEFVDLINTKTGYVATLLDTTKAATKANELDLKSSTSILTPLSLYRLQEELVEIINANSERVSVSLATTPVSGLPTNVANSFLSGGAKGASTNTTFSNGFSASLGEDYNVLLTGVSRDAADDIADAHQGFTDSASTYTIASVLTAADTHLRLRGDTKNRKEAQGFGGIRKTTKAAAFTAVSAIGSEYMQICIQDCLTIDASGSLRYMHPHVTAALAAGMRTGMAVGEPLTHKYPNVQDVGHFIDPETGLVTGDFNPGLDFDNAIDNGVLFLERASGGFRWVVDNTTYGQDDSFIYNRGSVMAASMFVNRTLRETADLSFVGKKISNGGALSIKNVLRNKLRELNRPDINIITSSDDAPEGFREDTFVVTITGNTARVQVEYKPVQGLDFVFFDFTIGDIQQSA
jgi:hypothetical protein